MEVAKHILHEISLFVLPQRTIYINSYLPFAVEEQRIHHPRNPPLQQHRHQDLSPAWIVKIVIDFPCRNDVQGPLPNDDDPSDHLIIAADLRLN